MSISIFSSNFATPKNEQMKILYIILFIQIGWIFPLSAQKQDSIYIGTRHTLFSEILNEERKYWIYVPETKAGEKGKAYPVLYLLDGDSFFHSVVGFTRFFSSSKNLKLTSLHRCGCFKHRPDQRFHSYLLSRPPGWYHLSL